MRNYIIGFLGLVFIGGIFPGCTELSHFFNPSNEQTDSHYLQGRTLVENGDLEAALDELSKAVQTEPNHVEALTLIGDIYRKSGHYELAHANYTAACQADPYAFRPHYNLGVVCQAMAELSGDTEETHTYLREAIATYIRAIAIDLDNFDTHLNLGACYFQLGKVQLAEHNTLLALEINPQSTRANNNLAIICQTQDRYDEAINAYEVSLETRANQPDVLMKLGAIYIQTGRYESAATTLSTATHYRPNDAALRKEIGTCYFHMKRFDEALVLFQQAIRLDNYSPGAYRSFGVVCMYKYVMNRSRTDLRDKALLAWRFSLRLKPGQSDLVELVQRYAPTATVVAEAPQPAPAVGTQPQVKPQNITTTPPPRASTTPPPPRAETPAPRPRPSQPRTGQPRIDQPGTVQPRISQSRAVQPYTVPRPLSEVCSAY
jgi:tetratricopeptide (TPR) repeat protein